MKFKTGSNNKLTQKYEKVKVQNDIRTSKQTSPIFNCVTPVSVSLAMLARQLNKNIQLTSDVLEHKWRASLKTIILYMNDFDF